MLLLMLLLQHSSLLAGGGTFLSASRCNADGSQGYACPTTPTDRSIEDARAGIPRDDN